MNLYFYAFFHYNNIVKLYYKIDIYNNIIKMFFIKSRKFDLKSKLQYLF